MHTKPERAPPSTIQRKQPVLCEKGPNIGHASRWPSWRSTADSTWTRPSSSVIGSTLDINPISSIQTFDDCHSLPYCVQAMAGSNCTSHAKHPLHGDLADEEDPGGHQHLLPAQDDSSTLLFGYCTISSASGTSENEDKFKTKEHHHLASTEGAQKPEKDRRKEGRSSPSSSRRNEACNINKIILDNKNAKEAHETSTKNIEMKFRVAETERKIQEDKVRKNRVRKTAEEEGSKKIFNHNLHIQRDKLGTNLLVSGPDTWPGRPGYSSRTSTSASPPSSWSLDCRRRPDTIWDEVQGIQGEKGGLQEKTFGGNIGTLLGTRPSKHAVLNSNLFVPLGGGKTTSGVAPGDLLSNESNRKSLICGADLGLVDHQHIIPGDFRTPRNQNKPGSSSSQSLKRSSS